MTYHQYEVGFKDAEGYTKYYIIEALNESVAILKARKLWFNEGNKAPIKSWAEFASWDSTNFDTVEKRGDKWCVLHGHPQKTGSKTDKPAGTAIDCYSIAEFGEEGARKKAMAMHYAIVKSQERGDSKCIYVEVDSNGKSQIQVIEL
jgi:hypothetical protein